jgi:tRNA dimethylallyltransferase
LGATVDGIAITGPTASGKTALALAVAARLGGEIISMDSRQVYRGMDIGTAKPSRAELAMVPHHGIDLLPPSERYSAGRFAEDARRWMSEIRERGSIPILVGGTGFFLRALTQPMFEEPALDRSLKDRVKRYLDSLSREELLRWLRSLDHATAQRLEFEGGRHRLARAIEVALLTGRPLSAWHAEQDPPEPLQLLTFFLDLPREDLYGRINRRVDQMIDAGLVAEVRALIDAGYDEHAPAMNATGYIELISHIRGERTLASAIEEIKNRSRAYARRQLTWFRHQLSPSTIELDATRPLEEMTDEVVERFQSARSA